MWNVALLRAQHQKFLRDHDAMVMTALLEAGRHAKEHVKARGDFERRSANSLKDSTKSHIIPLASGKKLRLQWPKKHASWIEDGTGRWSGRGPYKIRPRRAKALRFKVGGRIVFARSVTHPGIKPRKFGRNATQSAFVWLGRRLKLRMEQIAKRA